MEEGGLMPHFTGLPPSSLRLEKCFRHTESEKKDETEETDRREEEGEDHPLSRLRLFFFLLPKATASVRTSV